MINGENKIKSKKLTARYRKYHHDKSLSPGIIIHFMQESLRDERERGQC